MIYLLKAYITCAWGVNHVGYVLICYGAADAIGSITCGSIVKRVGRIPIFIFGASLNAALITTLFLWRPDPSNSAVFFVIAALWGLSDSIWQTQINCTYFIFCVEFVKHFNVFSFFYHSILRRHLCWF